VRVRAYACARTRRTYVTCACVLRKLGVFVLFTLNISNEIFLQHILCIKHCVC